MLEKLVGTILTIIAGFLIEWWRSSRDNSKRSTEQRKTDFDISEKLNDVLAASDDDVNRPKKNRYSKLILRNDNADIIDLKFLIKSVNLDYWAPKYFKSKKFITLIRNSETNEIILLSYDSSKTKIRWLFVGYLVFAMIGFSPYIFSVEFERYINKSLENQSYIFVLMIIGAFASLILAYSCMRQAGQEYSAKTFVRSFNERGLRSFN
ncbi:hypothetical protein GJV03_08225 [Acinetobacter sp. RIT698]|nr:hypothetical protein [Acinetobacter sp. RIT698]MRT37142.1 hypothetical protein [Acinetobacter sp. RIT698]